MSKKEGKTAAKAIAESAHQIWLAGLGAFAKAQAEGSRVFEKLIREGAELEAKARKHGKENMSRIRDRAIQAGEKLRKQGQDSMDRIHSAIDDSVARAVERLSLPTQADLAQLAERLEQLGRDFTRSATDTARSAGEAFQDVAKARPAAAKRAGKSRPASKAGAKTTAPGKSTAKAAGTGKATRKSAASKAAKSPRKPR